MLEKKVQFLQISYSYSSAEVILDASKSVAEVCLREERRSHGDFNRSTGRLKVVDASRLSVTWTFEERGRLATGEVTVTQTRHSLVDSFLVP